MPTFAYKALKKDGTSYEASTTAPDTFALARDLRARGETLITANVSEKKRFSLARLSMLSTVGEQDKIMLARNLGSMVKAGLPLARALSVIERQMKNPKLVSIVKGVSEEIKKGKSLAGALGAHPKVFSKLFVSMVRAGEESGTLSESLAVLAEQMERSYTLKKKVRGAMIYPAVIIAIMALLGTLMFVFVVPTLTSTFESLDAELPLSTQVIIGISNVVTTHPSALLLTLGVLILGLVLFLRTRSGHRTMHFLFLHIPVIRTITKETNAASTARTFASLLQSGVEIVNALSITRDVVQNSYFKEVLAEAEDAIQKGKPVSEVFSAHDNLYPSLVGEMMSVGEETGKLSEMLANLAEYYEEEVNRKTKDLSTIIEPVLMVIIGTAVGFFAFSVITPIYSLVDAL